MTGSYVSTGEVVGGLKIQEVKFDTPTKTHNGEGVAQYKLEMVAWSTYAANVSLISSATNSSLQMDRIYKHSSNASS
ncbi:hypothetical protein LTR15_006196 [Elasticomyces elasticus]|nr:hypothetical protein LTR15_006196 [Elasticomyces elasticus]